jgi:hypothetical protein
MQNTLRVTATVMPGHRVEVIAPELREGEAVEVILVLPEEPKSAHLSALDIINGLNGHRLFKSAQEVNDHLQEERDAWDC